MFDTRWVAGPHGRGQSEPRSICTFQGLLSQGHPPSRLAGKSAAPEGRRTVVTSRVLQLDYLTRPRPRPRPCLATRPLTLRVASQRARPASWMLA
jgi:hypothetical protein